MFVFRKHFASPCAPCMLRSISGGSSLKGKSCYCMQSSMPLDSQVVRCSCINPNWAQSNGFLSKSNPLKRCSLYREGWPWCSCYHGVKTVRCSCINLSYPESWLRSSEKGETANLRPSPQKGLRTTHRWETSVRNQVKGPGHSQKRNLGV